MIILVVGLSSHSVAKKLTAEFPNHEFIYLEQSDLNHVSDIDVVDIGFDLNTYDEISYTQEHIELQRISKDLEYRPVKCDLDVGWHYNTYDYKTLTLSNERIIDKRLLIKHAIQQNKILS